MQNNTSAAEPVTLTADQLDSLGFEINRLTYCLLNYMAAAALGGASMAAGWAEQAQQALDRIREIGVPVKPGSGVIK